MTDHNKEAALAIIRDITAGASAIMKITRPKEPAAFQLLDADTTPIVSVAAAKPRTPPREDDADPLMNAAPVPAAHEPASPPKAATSQAELLALLGRRPK